MTTAQPKVWPDTSLSATPALNPTCHMVTLAALATPDQQVENPILALGQLKRKHRIEKLLSDDH